MSAVGSWRKLLQEPSDHRHIVSLYRDEAFLVGAVAAWAGPALAAGGGVVLVGTPAHAEAIRARLRGDGVAVDEAERAGRLLVVDADGLMARFLFGGQPDGPTFRLLARNLVSRARDACAPGAEVRAWGEMVNLLRTRGNPEAAKRLEALWNEVIGEQGIHLLCSYEVDNLSSSTHEGVLRDVCAGHSALIPEEDDERFETAVSRALVDVFGPEAPTVRQLFAQRRTVPAAMPPAEAILVALHEVQPQLGRRVLASARSHLESLTPR